MSGWGGNVCRKTAKTPRNPLNSASPQHIAGVEALITLSSQPLTQSTELLPWDLYLERIGSTSFQRHLLSTTCCSDTRGYLMSTCIALNQNTLPSQHLEIIESPWSQTQKWLSSCKAAALRSHAVCSYEDLEALWKHHSVVRALLEPLLNSFSWCVDEGPDRINNLSAENWSPLKWQPKTIKPLNFFTYPKHFFHFTGGDIIANASLPILIRFSSLSVLRQQKPKSYHVWGRKHLLPLLGRSSHLGCFYSCAAAQMQSQLEICTPDLQLPWAHQSVP